LRIVFDALMAALAAMGIYLIFFALCSLGSKPLGQSSDLTLTASLGAGCSAYELERAVKRLIRLRRGGFADFDIEIRDIGLDQAAFNAAKLLTKEQGVYLIAPSKEN